MDTQHQQDDATPVDLTLRQAAQRYDVTARTLARHIRCGQLTADKVRGAAGREWRVTAAAMQAAGYPPRPSTEVRDTSQDPLVTQLRRELAAAQRAVAAERRRADDLDRRLGLALLQCGHLRAALDQAEGRPERADEALDATTANWLVATIRGTVTDHRRQQSLDR